jgi:UDP-N-acetylmuramate dehydrogenase
MNEAYQEFTKQLTHENLQFKINELLAQYTTWKIGGPADILSIANSIKEFRKLIQLSKQYNIPYTVLGGGSNVLISDAGLRGLTIINKINHLSINHESQVQVNEALIPRLQQLDTDTYYSFQDLNYDEGDQPKINVIVGSGFYLPQLINVLIAKGVTGLQWFAGIPGTIGGAIYNNIHGGSHFISEFVSSVTILNAQDEIITLPRAELDFDYDYSKFHNSKDIILEISLILNKGDTVKAQKAAMAWAQKKRIQPYRSAGCCFQNIDTPTMQKLNLQTTSWGYIIDNILHLKGTKIGDAVISDKHAAFIENTGKAKASDVLQLFDTIYQESRATLGITPKLEIFLLGFPESTVKKYNP